MKRIDIIFLSIFLTGLCVTSYSAGYYNGHKKAYNIFHKTIDSLKIDSDMWWKKLDSMKFEIDSIVFDLNTKQFENHSEIKP